MKPSSNGRVKSLQPGYSTYRRKIRTLLQRNSCGNYVNLTSISTSRGSPLLSAQTDAIVSCASQTVRKASNALAISQSETVDVACIPSPPLLSASGDSISCDAEPDVTANCNRPIIHALTATCDRPTVDSELISDNSPNKDPDENIDSTEDTDKSNGTSYKRELARWAVVHNISQKGLTALLQLNRKYHYGGDLPIDARTLLKTARQTITVPIAGGSYYHFGISKAICQLLCHSRNVVDGIVLDLQLNMDGIPIYKSTSSSLWPILGRLVNKNLKNNVFAIGAFYGGNKPLSIHEYLSAFIDEYLQIREDGMTIQGHKVSLKIHTIICDAPARAQVKCITHFSGYHGCDKCTIPCDYRHGSVKYLEPKPEPDEEAQHVTLREDSIFHTMVGHPGHHRGRSPFLRTEVGMVTQFPGDYMHSVLLGVMRLLLHIWVGNKRFKSRSKTVTMALKWRHLLSRLLTEIDAPSEFKRKPRAIKELSRWKATEFRQFLLYTGMVVLKQTFREAGMTYIYEHFLKLVCAMRILLSESLCEHWEYARTLLHIFLADAVEIYGSKLFVYNIHSLTHLADEAGLYGNLDNISGFPFENHLGRLKKLVRKPGHTLIQVVRRLQEINAVADIEDKVENVTSSTVFMGRHTRGPVPKAFAGSAEQYTRVVHDGIRYALAAKDNCVMIGSKIGSIINVLKHSGEAKVVVRFYKTVNSFFDKPLDSRRVGIARIGKSLEPELHVFNQANITKCYVMTCNITNCRVVAAYASLIREWIVAEFAEGGEIEILPSNWCSRNGKYGYWPEGISSSKITKLIQKCVFMDDDPNLQYTKHKITIKCTPKKDWKIINEKLKLLMNQTGNDSVNTDYDTSSGRVKRKMVGRKSMQSDFDVYDSDVGCESDGNVDHLAEIIPPTPKAKKGHKKTNMRFAGRPCDQALVFQDIPVAPESLNAMPVESVSTPVGSPAGSRSIESPRFSQISAVSDCGSGVTITGPQPDNAGPDNATPETSMLSSVSTFSDPGGILETLLKSHVDMKATQQQMFNMVSNVQASFQHFMQQSLQPPAMTLDERHKKLLQGVNFPIKELSDLLVFDQKLINNDFAEAVIAKIAPGSAGCSLEDMTRKLLYRLLAKSLAMQLNWKGKGTSDKIGMSAMTLRYTLHNAVRRRYDEESAENRVDVAAKLWLRNARDLDGGRSQRLRSRLGASCSQTGEDVDNLHGSLPDISGDVSATGDPVNTSTSEPPANLGQTPAETKQGLVLEETISTQLQ